MVSFVTKNAEQTFTQKKNNHKQGHFKAKEKKLLKQSQTHNNTCSQVAENEAEKSRVWRRCLYTRGLGRWSALGN